MQALFNESAITAPLAPIPGLQREAGGGRENARRERTRCLIDDLATEVMRAGDPGRAAGDAIAKLRATIAFRLDLLYGCKRMPAVVENPDAEHQALLDSLWHGADPA